MIIVSPENCCGCRACLQVCPRSAIQVIYDDYGFEQIRVNDDLCINCGKCRKICPIIKMDKSKQRILCGSAYSIDNEIKKSGSSGGLFGTFAKYFIKHGGVVYGAAFDHNLHLKTTRTDSMEQLKALYQSKYLLCDTTGAYVSIKKDLETGRLVLYCSSPCQISALKNFLNKEYTNLLCIEFICHGVGSQKQFDQSVEYIEKKNNIKILSFKFREKLPKASSHYYYSYTYYDKKKQKKRKKTDIYMTFPYYYSYHKRITCREICYSCPYATEERTADISIGDFHGIEKYDSSVDRLAGVSMFVCNSQKGKSFFDLIESDLVVKEYDWQVIKNNNRFSGKDTILSMRDDYLQILGSNKYEHAYKRFLNYFKDWKYYYYHTPRLLRTIGNKYLRRK